MKGGHTLHEKIKFKNKEIAKLAEDLGYHKINQMTRNSQLIFSNAKNYISFDVDQHNILGWKMASSPQKLNSKTTRTGTFSLDLKTRIKD